MSVNVYNLILQKKIPKFEEIGKDGFIWIPLTSIPIDEHLLVNSMQQPVLKIFPLLSWSAILPLATDEQIYLKELALKHSEMGYFVLHYKDVFGIIGVEEYHDYWRRPGRAVIFNCNDKRKKENITELNLVYSNIKYPYKGLAYSPGEFSDYDSIHSKSPGFGYEDFDE